MSCHSAHLELLADSLVTHEQMGQALDILDQCLTEVVP